MNDEVVIELAIARQSRSRYRQLLADPKKRPKLLDKLNHCAPLDERRTIWYKSFDRVLEVAKVKSTASVYLLSAAKELDGKTMPFAQAVDEVRWNGWGTIILVSPTLALYYDEEGQTAAIIQRKD